MHSKQNAEAEEERVDRVHKDGRWNFRDTKKNDGFSDGEK
jgi:hypothetical protein